MGFMCKLDLARLRILHKELSCNVATPVATAASAVQFQGGRQLRPRKRGSGTALDQQSSQPASHPTAQEDASPPWYQNPQVH
jgi:hypothetical protein